MTHASVFSGIGGPEVAATMLGWENLFHCEINPFGRQVLDYWYPNSKSYEDITTTDFTEWRGRVDVLTGGFPCQPFSYAGRRRGAEDDRYLWPSMYRAIDEIQPTWVVAENVAGILTMVEQGEVSKVAGSATLFDAFDDLRGRYELRETFTLQRICTDLESHGYAVQPVLVPACAVGAPHRRDRVFIVARRVEAVSEDTMHGGQLHRPNEEQGSERHIRDVGAGDSQRLRYKSEGIGNTRNMADTDSKGLERAASLRVQDDARRGGHDGIRERTWQGSEVSSPRTSPNTIGGRVSGLSNNGEQCDEGHHGQHQPSGQPFGFEHQQGWVFDRWQENGVAGLRRWESFPSVSPIFRGNDGLPFDVDRLTLSFGKWRTEALKAYGNAIVPQVMYEIFRAIEQVETH